MNYEVIASAKSGSKVSKVTRISFWVSTIIIALMMIFSAYSYFANPMAKEGFIHLGFPDYFRVELGIAKLAGAILLLLPLRFRIKEWAYAGFTIIFISAFISHFASGDPVANSIIPLVLLIPLAISYFTWHKLQAANRPAIV